MDEQKIAAENQFIYDNRLGFARLGPQQFRETGEKGLLLVQRPTYENMAGEIRYLPVSVMQSHDLLEHSASIGQAVQTAVNQYHPLKDVVILFLYLDDATVYLLNIEDDLLN